MLGPKNPIRERILGVGPAGSGKSTAAVDLAIKIPEANFYVMDAEYGGAWTPDGGRMNPSNELPNIHPRPATDWESFATSAKEFRKLGRPHDWLVVDLIGTAYDLAQEHYIERVKGVRVDDFYEAFAEKRGNKKNPLDGDTDWQFIKKIYNAVMSDILSFPGHVLALATAKAPGRSEYEKAEVRDLYQHLGVRPEGHWKLSSLFSTILYFRQKGGVWQFTTVRERNPRVGLKREYVENKEWGDFGRAYLWDVAHWRPGK